MVRRRHRGGILSIQKMSGHTSLKPILGKVIPELPLEGWLGAGRSGEEWAPSLQGWQHEGRDRERSLEVESPTLKER